MSLISLVSLVFRIWQILLFVYVVLSWVPQVPRSHPAVQLIASIVEPTLAPFRRLMPMAGLDISPIIAFFVYSAAVQVILQLLARSLGAY